MAKGSLTQARILQTAIQLAGRFGLEGLTIGGLAKAVGMSKSGLFAHFNSKDNLQLMVFQNAAGHFTHEVLRKSFKAPRGEPRVRAILENWIAYLHDSRSMPGANILIAASIEQSSRPGPLRDFVKKVQVDLLAQLERAAKIACEEGHFRKNLDADLFAWSMYSYVLGYHHSWRMLDDPKAEEHLRASFENLILFSKDPSGERKEVC